MLNRWRYRKAVKRSKKETEIVARGLLEMHYLAITAHGRVQLRTILEHSEEYDIHEVVLGMYEFFYRNAPVGDYALFN